MHPWVRDAALMVALTTALVSLDARQTLGILWWTLPAGLLAAALTQPVRALNGRQLMAIGLLTVVLAGRGLGTLAGPLPEAGLREAMDLAIIFILSLVLWYCARGNGLRTTAVWTVALLLGWAMETGLAWTSGEASSAARPAMGLAGLGGALICFFELRRQRRSGSRPARRKVRGWAGWPARLIALGLGLLMGRHLVQWPSGIGQTLELQLSAGQIALQQLWLQSLLVGWGRHAIATLAEVLAEPHRAAFYPWGGPWALLAMGGLAGVGLHVVLCIALVARRRVLLEALGDRPVVPPGAMAVALLLGGIVLGGGPMSASVLLTFVGWTALALARPWQADDPRDQWSLKTSMATAVAVGGLILLTILLSLPVRGNRLLAVSQRSGLTLDQQQTMLAKARRLNPYNPAIVLRQATLTREQMNRTEGWSESLFQRVVQLYEQAERLSPYDTMIPLRHAEFLERCDRQENAVAVIGRGLERRPHASDLSEWLYLTARRLNQPQEVYRTLERGLHTAPTEPLWWLRMFEQTRQQGQMLLARQALDVALTVTPIQPQLVAEAWKMRYQAQQGPAVTLPVLPRPADSAGSGIPAFPEGE